MTGIRSWTVEVTAFGVVVRIEQVLIQLPLGSFHRSHNPANANNSPSLTSKQYGCLAFPVHPLVKPICGDHAPAGFHGIASCTFVYFNVPTTLKNLDIIPVSELAFFI